MIKRLKKYDLTIVAKKINEIINHLNQQEQAAKSASKFMAALTSGKI